eukprot:295054-Chlamydomonas_euryale.AAC.1
MSEADCKTDEMRPSFTLLRAGWRGQHKPASVPTEEGGREACVLGSRFEPQGWAMMPEEEVWV